jgi:hypothetical protein
MISDKNIFMNTILIHIDEEATPGKYWILIDSYPALVQCH